MSKSAPALPVRRGLGRIGTYYVALAVATFVLVRYVPIVGDTISSIAGGGAVAAGSLFGPDDAPVGTTGEVSAWREALVATISMLGALAIMVPVTWVYMVTKWQRSFHESVLHTMLILPVAVTGIVMVVSDNLALAFSLAGIVAAVRFRTTLEDTKDAVYVFLAIGVGLASGVQALGLALALSVVFNAVVLVLWTTKFGNVYASTPAGAFGLGDVLAGPASAAGALSVGDSAIIAAASPADLAEVAERAVRIERHITEERTKKKRKRANALILVHAKQAEAAQSFVDPLLEELTTTWKLAEVSPGPSGFVLHYLARLDDATAQGAVMDRMRGAPEGTLEAAELRSLKGIKPKA